MITRLRHRGLRVVHQRHPGKLTAIAISIRAGARFDGAHPGLAHLAEHMLFQGTPRLDQMALNRRAAELGGEHNADTGYDKVCRHLLTRVEAHCADGFIPQQRGNSFLRQQVDAAFFKIALKPRRHFGSENL